MELSGKPIVNNLKPFQGCFDFFQNHSANFFREKDMTTATPHHGCSKNLSLRSLKKAYEEVGLSCA